MIIEAPPFILLPIYLSFSFLSFWKKGALIVRCSMASKHYIK